MSLCGTIEITLLAKASAWSGSGSAWSPHAPRSRLLKAAASDGSRSPEGRRRDEARREAGRFRCGTFVGSPAFAAVASRRRVAASARQTTSELAITHLIAASPSNVDSAGCELRPDLGGRPVAEGLVRTLGVVVDDPGGDGRLGLLVARELAGPDHLLLETAEDPLDESVGKRPQLLVVGGVRSDSV